MIEDTSKGDMLLKTGQMAVRVMRDFQVCLVTVAICYVACEVLNQQ